MNPEAYWFQACGDNNVIYVTENVEQFKGQRDSRPLNFSDRIITGFTGLQYAAYYDSFEVLKVLFQYELELNVDRTFTIAAHGINNSVKCQLTADSNILMLAMLRGSRRCIEYIHQQISSNKEIASKIVGKLNSNKMTNLSSAVITSNVPECYSVFTDKLFYESELDLSVSTKNIMNYICQMGQLRCLLFIGELMDNGSDLIKRKIINLLLKQPTTVPGTHPYILDCEEPLAHPDRYYTSDSFKQKCKITIIEMIQRALDVCVLSKDPELTEMLENWRTLHYVFLEPKLQANRQLEIRLFDYQDLQAKVLVSTVTEGIDVFKGHYLSVETEDCERLRLTFRREQIKQCFRLSRRLSNLKNAQISIDLERWFAVDRQFVVRNIKRYCREADSSSCAVIHHVVAKDDLELFKQLLRSEKYMKVTQNTTIKGMDVVPGTDFIQLCLITDAIKIIRYLFETQDMQHYYQNVCSAEQLLICAFTYDNEATRFTLEQPSISGLFSKNLSYNPLLECSKFNNIIAAKQLKKVLCAKGQDDLYNRLALFNKNNQRVDTVSSKPESKQYFEQACQDALDYSVQYNWFYKPEFKPIVMNFCNVFEMENMLKKYTDRDANIIIRKDATFKDENDQSAIIPKYIEQTSFDWLSNPKFEIDQSKLPFKAVHPDILTTFSKSLVQFDSKVQSLEVSRWFDMAANGNTNYIKNNMQQYNGLFDKRSTRSMVINGFSALMYAIVNKQMDIVNLLLDCEGKLYNNQETVYQYQNTIWFKSMSPAELLIMFNDSYMINYCWKKVCDLESNILMHLVIYTKADESMDSGIIMNKFIQLSKELLNDKSISYYTVFHYLCERSDLAKFKNFMKVLEMLPDPNVKYAFYIQLLSCFINKSMFDCIKDDQLIRLIYKYILSGLALLSLSENKQYSNFAQNASEQMKLRISIPETVLLSDKECKKMFYKLPQKAVSSNPKRLEFDHIPHIIYLENLQVGNLLKIQDRDKYLQVPDTRMTNIQSQTFYGFSALMYAVMGGNQQNVQSLLSELSMVTKTPVAIRTKSRQHYIYLLPGSTALHVALACGNQAIFDFLISKMKENQIIVGQSLSLLALISDLNVPLNIMESELDQDPELLIDLILNDFNQKILRIFLLDPFSQDTLLKLTPVWFATNIVKINKKTPNKQQLKDQLEPIFNRVAVTQGCTEKLEEQINEFYGQSGFLQVLEEDWKLLTKTSQPVYVTYDLLQNQVKPIQRGTASSFYPFVPEYDKYFKAIQHNQSSDMLKIVNDNNFMSKYLDRSAYDETFGYPINLVSIQEAVVYRSDTCFSDLATLIGINHLTRVNTLIDFSTKIRYIPKDSNILHLAILSENDFVIRYCLKSRDFRSLLLQYNSLGDTPLEVSIKINQLDHDIFISAFLSLNFDDAIIILAKIIRQKNPSVPQFLAQLTLLNQQFKELYLSLIIVLKQQDAFEDTDHIIYYYNDFLKAITYAYKNQTQPNVIKCFERIYGNEIKDSVDGLSNELSYTRMLDSDKFNYQFLSLGDSTIVVPDEARENWFTACFNNDVNFVKLFMFLVGQRDVRQTDYKKGIFRNFTGLQYAIFNDSVDVVKLLLSHEVNKLLLDQQRIHSEFFENGFQLPGQSSILMLAMVRNSTKTIQYIHQVILANENYYKLIIINQRGLTHLSLAVQLVEKQQLSYTLLNDEKFIIGELELYTESDTNFIKSACQKMLVGVIIKMIDFLINGSAKLKQRLCRFILKSNSDIVDQIPFIKDFDQTCGDGDFQDSENQKQCKYAIIDMLQMALDLAVFNNDQIVGNWKQVRYQYGDSQSREKFLQVNSKDLVSKRFAGGCIVYMDQRVQKLLHEKEETFKEIQSQLTQISTEGQQSVQQLKEWREEHEAKWFEACTNNDTEFVELNFHLFLGKRDCRKTDFKAKVIENFTGLQYATFYDNIDVVKILLTIESNVDIDLTFNIIADGISPGLKCQIAPQTTILMLSMLRGSHKCTKYIHQLVKTDPNIAKSVIGKLNTNSMSNLSAAVLTSSKMGSLAVFCDLSFLEKEIELGSEADGNIINYCCKMGSLNCMMKLHDLLTHGSDQIKRRLIKLLLATQFTTYESISYVQDCRSELQHFEKYNTSPEIKRKCEIILLDMLQNSLDYAVNYKMFDYLKFWKHISYDYRDINGECCILMIHTKEEIELLLAPDELYKTLEIKPIVEHIQAAGKYLEQILDDKKLMEKSNFKRPTTKYYKEFEIWINAIVMEDFDEINRLSPKYKYQQCFDPTDAYYSFCGLHHAILNNKLDAAKVLKSEVQLKIQRCIEINGSQLQPGDSALELCICLKQYDMFSYLVNSDPGFAAQQLQSFNIFYLQLLSGRIVADQQFWHAFMKNQGQLQILIEQRSSILYQLLFTNFLLDSERKQLLVKLFQLGTGMLSEEMLDIIMEKCAELGAQDEAFIGHLKNSQVQSRIDRYAGGTYSVRLKCDPFQSRFRVTASDFIIQRSQGMLSSSMFDLFEKVLKAAQLQPYQYLIPDSRGYNQQDKMISGFFAVHYAIYYNNLELLKNCIKISKFICTRDEVVLDGLYIAYNTNPLLLALQLRNREAVKIIVELCGLQPFTNPNRVGLDVLTQIGMDYELINLSDELMILKPLVEMVVRQRTPLNIIKSVLMSSSVQIVHIAQQFLTDEALLKVFYQQLIMSNPEALITQWGLIYDSDNYQIITEWVLNHYADALHFGVKNNIWTQQLQNIFGNNYQKMAACCKLCPPQIEGNKLNFKVTTAMTNSSVIIRQVPGKPSYMNTSNVQTWTKLDETINLAATAKPNNYLFSFHQMNMFSQFINKPVDIIIDNQTIKFTTQPKTDFWNKTYYGFSKQNGHALLTSFQDKQSFSCTIANTFQGQFHQGGIIVYQDDQNWAKIGIELENGIYYCSSVVTNHDRSDWATQVVQKQDSYQFRISKLEKAYKAEVSFDGKIFNKMRLFGFESVEATVGIYACSPMETGFEVKFLSFGFDQGTLFPFTH